MNVSGTLRKGYHYFRRPNITALIILILVLLFILGLFIPQKRLFRSSSQYNQWRLSYPVSSGLIESLKLNEIYVAPITVLFLSLFFLNLVVVVVHRLPHILRRSYLWEKNKGITAAEKLNAAGLTNIISIDCEAGTNACDIPEKASSFFKKRYWSVLRTNNSEIVLAIRNRFSPFGFLFFHLSFLFCLVGGLMLVYTRFSGNLTLTEGETFHADMAQFRTIKDDPVLFRALPDFGLTLLDVIPRYDGTVATDLDVRLGLQYETERAEVTAKINEPVTRGPISILPSNLGISPLFVVKRQTGEEVEGGYFSLNVLKGDEDSFSFLNLSYKIYVKFYPDYFARDGEPSTRSLELKNPVFRLRIERNGSAVFNGLVRLGEKIQFDGFELFCPEVRYWVDFLVIREYGNGLLFAGFLMGAAGLVMRLVFYQKTVAVSVKYYEGQCILLLAGRSEYYPQLFREEFEMLTRALADHMGGSVSRHEGEL